MAKWSITTGICGPTVLHTTCIGDTKEEAVRKLIEEEKENEKASWESEEMIKKFQMELEDQEYVPSPYVPKPDSYWEERYEEYVKRAVKFVRPKPEKKGPLKDYFEQLIKIGDTVAFIRNKRKEPTRLMSGKVTKICNSSVTILADDGIEYRVMTESKIYHDQTKIPKVIIIPEREERTGDVKDATGYPIKEGDKIAYMGAVHSNVSESFETSVVKKVSRGLIYFDVPFLSNETRESRRAFNRLIVVE